MKDARGTTLVRGVPTPREIVTARQRRTYQLDRAAIRRRHARKGNPAD